MIAVRIKNGYDLNIAGRPLPETATAPPPGRLAALPERIPFVKPKLAVGVGDSVRQGSVLYVDKRNPAIKFLSPGSGRIDRINLGPRRVVREIVVALDGDDAYETFDAVSETALDAMEREALVRRLLDGGLWPLIRALPFRDIAGPRDNPPAILVNIGNSQPFHPEPEIYLKDKVDLFKFGLKALRRLTDGNVHVSINGAHPMLPGELDGLITHRVSGRHPANDPGVLLYHIRKSGAENRSWFIDGQDLLLIAALLKTGRYPTERTVVVAGSRAAEKKHWRTRLGAPLADLIGGGIQKDDTRLIAGGVLTGYSAEPETFLGFYETALALVPKGHEREFLAFVRPGIKRPSYSRTFLSALSGAELEMNCNLHGGLRACIGCGHCMAVCPVEILPQLAYKSILAGEVEESLAHGLLDCAECGLCSYVCPSKIELFSTLRTAKAAYYKEIS
ncbi:MAG: Na(+)-translocating NADH-quinone reductase subunit A [Thermodesulfobacteriota bacterium]